MRERQRGGATGVRAPHLVELLPEAQICACFEIGFGQSLHRRDQDFRDVGAPELAEMPVQPLMADRLGEPRVPERRADRGCRAHSATPLVVIPTEEESVARRVRIPRFVRNDTWASAACTAAINARMSSGRFNLFSSTPELTSTPHGCAAAIASPTLSGVRPPARNASSTEPLKSPHAYATP